MKAKVMKSSLAAALNPLRGTAMPNPNVKVSVENGRIVFRTITENWQYSTSAEVCTDDDKGCAFVSLKQLTKIVTSLPPDVVSVEDFGDCGLQLKSAGVEYRIASAANEVGILLFNIDPIETAKKTFDLPVAVFFEVLRKVKYAASEDPSRRSLCGVMFTFVDGVLTAVATDGRRLATVDYDTGEKELTTSLFLPNEVVGKLFEIVRYESWRDYSAVVKFAVWDGLAKVDVESRRFSAVFNIIDSQFPLWKHCVPDSTNRRAVFPRDRMLEAIRRCSSVGHWGCGRGVLFEFSGQGCKLTIEEEEFVYHESLPCRLESEPFSVMFDPRYVADICKAYDDDMITVTTKAADDNRVNAPCKFETSIPSIAVLMTMRIS